MTNIDAWAGRVDLIVSSPPYADILNSAQHGIKDERRKKSPEDIQSAHYGQTPGQLGGMKEGTYPEDTMKQEAAVDQWAGCYSANWVGVIQEDSFAHPAKYSRALIQRIYAHLAETGAIWPVAVCLDPFGGVGLGALDAMFHGCQWIGCELEPRFAALGLENIALWNERYKGWPGWGRATLLNGDSRRLREVVQGADCVVSSPPYAESHIESDCQRQAKNKDFRIQDVRKVGADKYGQTPGQLGNLKEGDFAAVISSPPYVSGGHHTDVMGAWNANGGGHGVTKDQAGYGTSPGQLGGMKDAGFDAACIVSSPPYSGEAIGHKGEDKHPERAKNNSKLRNMNQYGGYGDSPGQLGHEKDSTFWEAARAIVTECYHLLRPGGHACWVVKGFVRKKAYVDFPGQWQQLCESVGFQTIHEHRAMLVTDAGEQGMLFGDDPEQLVKARKSFFRRLAEKKGSPAIDFEVVLCMTRP